METVFDRYLTSGAIIENRGVLRSSYTPDRLLHRSKETNQLAAVLSTAIRGESPSNVLIYGQTGTGKTAVCKFIGKEIDKMNRRAAAKSAKGSKDPVTKAFQGNPVSYVYINCKIVNTTYGVLANIGNRFIKDWSEDVIPFTGWPTEKVYSSIKEKIDEQDGIILIFLDEIDQLCYNSGDDALYFLTGMSTTLKDDKVSIIGISNDLRFNEFLDPKVKSRLGEERITFAPYKANQLADILRQRAKLALVGDAWDEGVIQLCAALAAEENGDARKALDLLRISSELAERAGATTLVEEHVREAQVQIEKDVISQVIGDLPTQQKIVLLAITMEQVAGREKLITGEVYETYNIIARKLNMNVLTPRSISGMISELDMLGICMAKVISKGRYGRTKEIELAVHPNLVQKVLVQDPIFEELLAKGGLGLLRGWRQSRLL